jgi:integrase
MTFPAKPLILSGMASTIDTHLQPLRRRAPASPAPTSRRVSIDRCVDLMATRYQWAETTRVNARDYLAGGRFLAFCQARGIETVDQLSNEAILDFVGDVRDRVGVSRNTLRRYRNYFRRLADFCATTPGFANPFFTSGAVPSAPKEPRRRRSDALTLSEEQALVAALVGHRRDSLIVRVLLACGLRVSELCALCVDDVKLTARPPRLLVTKAHSDITKSGVDRQVTFRQPYAKELIRDLAAWIERYRPESRHPDLFISERRSSGEPLTTTAVQQMVQRAARSAGLRPIHPHLLRRTWATRLADAGATVTDLMQQAGWSSIEMVTVYYAGSEERAIERVAGLRVEG